MKYFFIYLLIINYLAWSLFHMDKEKAIAGKTRISEQNLLWVCLIGGSIGGWLSMKNYHHKTKKKAFKWRFYAIVVLQLFLLLFVFRGKI